MADLIFMSNVMLNLNDTLHVDDIFYLINVYSTRSEDASDYFSRLI